MKTIVIGDIHGCYNRLKTLIDGMIEDESYIPDQDRLIFLGDYIDRGADSRLVIKFIRELQEKHNNVIALSGNHEDMVIEYIKGYDDSWKINGSDATLRSYSGHREEFYNDLKWMEKLPLYFEDENFVYVHAGIECGVPMEKQLRNTLLWVRDSFIYSMDSFEKTVIFGHTPSGLVGGDDCLPYRTIAGNICIDTGCVFSGVLTALVIGDGKIINFQQTNRFTKEERMSA